MEDGSEENVMIEHSPSNGKHGYLQLTYTGALRH